METGPKTSSIESKRRKLVYADEFRETLREKPGIVKKAMELMRQAVDAYDPQPFEYRPGSTVRYDKKQNIWLISDPTIDYARDEHGRRMLDERGVTIMRELKEQPFYLGRGTLLVPGEPIADPETGLRVTVLGRSNRGEFALDNRSEKRVDQTDYFKIDVDGKSYFVKYSTVTQNPGFDEFQAAQKAKEALKDLDYVEIVDAKLGYQDDKRSWYIASWKELESAEFILFSPNRLSNDYGKYVERPRYNALPHDQFMEIYRKLREAKIGEDVEGNLFFIPGANKFFLLDVSSKDNEGIGQPYRRNLPY